MSYVLTAEDITKQQKHAAATKQISLAEQEKFKKDMARMVRDVEHCKCETKNAHSSWVNEELPEIYWHDCVHCWLGMMDYTQPIWVFKQGCQKSIQSRLFEDIRALYKSCLTRDKDERSCAYALSDGKTMLTLHIYRDDNPQTLFGNTIFGNFA